MELLQERVLLVVQVCSFRSMNIKILEMVDSHVTVVRTLGNISDYIYLVIRSPYIQKGLESTVMAQHKPD